MNLYFTMNAKNPTLQVLMLLHLVQPLNPQVKDSTLTINTKYKHGVFIQEVLHEALLQTHLAIKAYSQIKDGLFDFFKENTDIQEFLKSHNNEKELDSMNYVPNSKCSYFFIASILLDIPRQYRIKIQTLLYDKEYTNLLDTVQLRNYNQSIIDAFMSVESICSYEKMLGSITETMRLEEKIETISNQKINEWIPTLCTIAITDKLAKLRQSLKTPIVGIFAQDMQLEKISIQKIIDKNEVLSKNVIFYIWKYFSIQA